MTRRLGAVLAGGASRRFGSDKALALLGGKPLIDHVIERLAGQCDAVVVVGRDHPGTMSIADRPRPGLGPLGGLNAALVHAAAHGFAAVLTAGCDLPTLPRDLAKHLGAGPAVVAGQPLLGLWPAALAGALDAYLAITDDRSMAAAVARFAARRQVIGAVANVNTTADLAALRHGDADR